MSVEQVMYSKLFSSTYKNQVTNYFHRRSDIKSTMVKIFFKSLNVTFVTAAKRKL